MEKVCKFLEKKQAKDLARNRTGNVLVTLEIFNALIKRCPDDLNVFAMNINNVLSSVLKANDISLCELAEQVFQTYCRNLSIDLLVGDAQFIANFNQLAKDFIQLGSKSSGSSKAKIISLNAAKDISFLKSISESAENGKFLVEITIPFIIDEIHTKFTSVELLKTCKSLQSEHELSRKTTKVTTFDNSKHEDATKENNDKIDNNNNNDDNAVRNIFEVKDLSIDALKAFFSSTSSIQLAACCRMALGYITSNKTEQGWSCSLVEAITSWMPVQLRFLILNILTSKLEHEKLDEANRLLLLNCMTSLLSSSVNLVGLSVIDNLRLLISNQYQLMLGSNTTTSTSDKLVLAYSDAISSLATHTYYHDQIVDMIGEIIVKLNEAPIEALKNETVKSNKSINYKNYLETLLNNINNVLVVANDKKVVQRSSVPFDIFQSVINLLSVKFNILSDIELNEIYFKFLTILKLELTYECNGSTRPDHNNLISNNQVSIINLFYEQIEKIAANDNYNIRNYKILIELIGLLVNKFGTNAIVNGFPFFFDWQIVDFSVKSLAKSDLLKDNFGFLIIYYSTLFLKNDELQTKIESCISYRMTNDYWVVPISDNYGIIDNHKTKISLTKEEILEISKQTLIADYSDTIISSHYKYSNQPDMDTTIATSTDVDVSYVSNNNQANTTINNTIDKINLQTFSSLKEPAYLTRGENHSIKSAPLSARSVLNSKLNAPKVSELRSVIKNGISPQLHKSSQSIFTVDDKDQNAELSSILNDLHVSINEKGNLTLN